MFRAVAPPMFVRDKGFENTAQACTVAGFGTLNRFEIRTHCV